MTARDSKPKTPRAKTPKGKTIAVENIAPVATSKNKGDAKTTTKKQAKEKAAAKAKERESLLAARTKAMQLVKAIREEAAKKVKDIKAEAATKIAEATKGLKLVGHARPSGDGPGIIASMVEFLSQANKCKPLTKADLLAKLTQRFTNRDTDGMKKTINCQLPGRLMAAGYCVVKTGNGYFIQNQDNR